MVHLVEEVSPAADQPESWAIGQTLVTLSENMLRKLTIPMPFASVSIQGLQGEKGLSQDV
eukprot:1151394-Pelagomonas_calceolata.AAC.1